MPELPGKDLARELIGGSEDESRTTLEYCPAAGALVQYAA